VTDQEEAWIEKYRATLSAPRLERSVWQRVLDTFAGMRRTEDDEVALLDPIPLRNSTQKLLQGSSSSVSLADQDQNGHASADSMPRWLP
jgi:hypothetical protein